MRRHKRGKLRLAAGVLCGVMVFHCAGSMYNPMIGFAEVPVGGLSSGIQRAASLVENGGFETRQTSTSGSKEAAFWENGEYADKWTIWYSGSDSADLHDPTKARLSFDSADKQEGDQSLHFHSTAATKMLVSSQATAVDATKAYLLNARVKVDEWKEGYFSIKVKTKEVNTNKDVTIDHPVRRTATAVIFGRI